VELALYHMDKRDTSFRNADGFTVTDGRTRHEGVEFSAEAPVTETLSLGGWVSYARHTYRFADPSARAGETIVAGNDVDSAPRWFWNARALWRPVERVALELEWAHMGEYFTNADNSRTYPGHDVLNLRARWLGPNGVEWFGAVRNLADVDYAERADFSFGNDRYFPGEPLGVSVGVRVRR
jgi:outer membrane receptor protein involved in Fe transport